MKLESVLPPGPALLISLLLMSSPALAQQATSTPARVVWVSVFSLSQVASCLEAFRKLSAVGSQLSASGPADR